MVSIVAGLDRQYQPGRTDSLAPLSTKTEREQMWTLEVSMRTGIHEYPLSNIHTSCDNDIHIDCLHSTSPLFPSPSFAYVSIAV